jgi:hypothetical protein
MRAFTENHKQASRLQPLIGVFVADTCLFVILAHLLFLLPRQLFVRQLLATDWCCLLNGWHGEGELVHALARP